MIDLVRQAEVREGSCDREVQRAVIVETRFGEPARR